MANSVSAFHFYAHNAGGHRTNWTIHWRQGLKLINSSSIKSDFSSLPGRLAVILRLSSGACYPVWLLPKVMLPLRKYKLKWRVICCEADKLSESWWGKSSAEDREGRTARGKIEPVLLSKHHSMCWNLTNYIRPLPLCTSDVNISITKYIIIISNEIRVLQVCVPCRIELRMITIKFLKWNWYSKQDT